MEKSPNCINFTDKELEVIVDLINHYIMTTPYIMVRKDVKELESKVKGVL